MGDTHKTEPEAVFASTRVDPRAVFVITAGDVQKVAQQTVNRELSGVELMQVRAIIEGRENRAETILDAICMVLDVHRVPGTEQRSILARHAMSVRREALIEFYKRALDYFEGDLLERLMFLQCFAALDASEGHGLAWLYTDEFNTTLIQYQEAKEP
ncbi:MAG: hypothetical protein U9R15_01460 [Chloroflexota bacterium]|nr:hypothetical protein [Chloroflexota bacterium]